MEEFSLRAHIADGGGEHSKSEEDAEDQANRFEELTSGEFGERADTGTDGKRHSEQQADPPGSDDAPTKSEQGWGLGIAEDGGMSDGEILNADTRGDLIMEDAIDDGCEDGKADNFEEFSHKVGETQSGRH